MRRVREENWSSTLILWILDIRESSLKKRVLSRRLSEGSKSEYADEELGEGEIELLRHFTG